MARGGAANVIPRRAPVPDLAAGERRLEGATGHYLSRVLRLEAGDSFTAFDPAAGREADAVVIRIEQGAVSVRLDSVREGAVRAPRAVTWIQGLAKGDKSDAVVRDATELGATRILFSATRRSVPRLDSARALARAHRWSGIAEQAARQCGRSDVPVVAAVSRWEDAIHSCADVGARFCLSPGAPEPLGPALFDALARGTSLAFACGAEGGLEEDEVELAAAQGWSAVSLGSLVLRTETVAAAVLGAVLIWGDSRGGVVPHRNVVKSDKKGQT